MDVIKATIQGVYAENDQLVVRRDDGIGGPWALRPRAMGLELTVAGKLAAIKDLRPRDKVEILMSRLEQRVLEVRLVERNEALAKRSEELQAILKKNYAEDHSTTFPRKTLSDAERQKRDELTLAQTKKLLDDNVKDEVAFDICRWLLHTKNAELQAKGAELVLAHHLKSERLSELLPGALAASKDFNMALAAVTRAGVEKNALGQALKAMGDAAYTKGEGADAERCYQLLAKDFADVLRLNPALSSQLEPRLYELRHLWVGKQAPALVGTDPDGMPLQLSDYRGNVVLLRIWQGALLDVNALALEKSLLAKLEGKPFLCVSISQDAMAAQVKKAIQDQRITWPVLWDGGRGTVQRQLLRYSPQVTLYVIDAAGVIRARGSQVSAQLPTLIEELVAAAERK